MTSKERKELREKMEKTVRDASKNPSVFKEVLQQTGIYTSKGNLKKAFS